MRLLTIATSVCLSLAGCAGTPTQNAADLNAALNVAVSAETAYAASPLANPKTVATMQQLLAAAQAALVNWTNSPTPGQQAAVSAAIAALVAYEANAKSG